MIKTIPTSSGFIQGRNGLTYIKAVDVMLTQSCGTLPRHIRLDGISKVKGIIVNGGIEMDVKCARELAKTILEMTE